MITMTVRLIIMSHLSDVQSGLCDEPPVCTRIDFVKYLLLKYPDTLSLVDADGEWEIFLKGRENK